MKTALVAGGTGFIGVCLANELNRRGFSVTVYDKARNGCKYLNPQINFDLVDVRDQGIAGKFDYVYHLAAPAPSFDSTQMPEEHMSTNIWGTYNIMTSFPAARVIFASSSAAADPNSFHGVNKKCAEHFVNFHKNSVTIRFGSVFGEGQSVGRSKLSLFVDSLKRNEKVSIKGDGNDRIDYLYIHDLVDELIRIGESKIKGQTETGYGSSIKEVELYKLICKMNKKKENFRLVPSKKRPSIIHNLKYKIKEPRYGFLEGLRRTMRWYLEEEINGDVEGKSIR